MGKPIKRIFGKHLVNHENKQIKCKNKESKRKRCVKEFQERPYLGKPHIPQQKAFSRNYQIDRLSRVWFILQQKILYQGFRRFVYHTLGIYQM